MVDQRTSTQATIDGKSPIDAASLVTLPERPSQGWSVARLASRRLGVSRRVDPQAEMEWIEEARRELEVQREKRSR